MLGRKNPMLGAAPQDQTQAHTSEPPSRLQRNGRIMADSNRPKYISFDIYGTLINFDIDPTTRRLLDGRIS